VSDDSIEIVKVEEIQKEVREAACDPIVVEPKTYEI